MKIPNVSSSYITKKEFCEICGISESTCYKLIKNNEITVYKCCEGLLHYYQIPISDAISYLRNREQKSSIVYDHAQRMKKYYIKKLRDYPDLISAKDISIITGYSKEAIRTWIHNGIITGIVVRKKFCIAKCDLISFLTGAYYDSITRKTQIHRDDCCAIMNSLSGSRYESK